MKRCNGWWIAASMAGLLLAAAAHGQRPTFRSGGMPSRPRTPAPAGPAPAPAAAPAAVPAPAAVAADQGSGYSSPRGYNWWYNNGYRRPPIVAGFNPFVRVLHEPRFDWSFAQPLEDFTNPAASPGALHDSSQTAYQLWVPNTYRHAVPHALVLWVSAKPAPDEQMVWDTVCRRHGLLFAAAHQGGNAVHPSRRMRLTMDVLDDIRRRMNVDTDRIYVGGQGEGGRTACDLAYAYPEFVGGVLAVGGAAPLRQEPWLRDRAHERLSVALVCGELDPARREMEVLRAPSLRDAEVRHRLWSLPRWGAVMSPAPILEEILVWLETPRLARRTHSIRYPGTRMAEGAFPSPDLWSNGLVEEAKVRLKEARTRDSGLMLLEGVARRWKGTPAAARAEKMLAEHNARDKATWQSVFDRRQTRFLHSEATALDAYLAGPLPPRDLFRKRDLLQASLVVWEAVERHGGNGKEAQQATRRLEQLRQQVQAR